MIKAIIFDFGGVVITNGTKTFTGILAERYGVPLDSFSHLDKGIGSDYRRGKITRHEFWNQVFKDLHISGDIDSLEEEWVSHYKTIRETIAMIEELRKKYKVYYLSDNRRDRVEKINNNNTFLHLFEDGIFSSEVGIRKPDPEIYKLALQKANVEPKEAVFIDDKEKNLIPAIGLGMHGIHFTEPSIVRKELQKLGILI
jgi:epoxide hydrolase-like predicted phosphatase